MTVTIRDRAAEAPWGSGPTRVRTRKIIISAFCPTCGERRGKRRALPQYDDGESYWVHTWTNECGHQDFYAAALKEADRYEHAAQAAYSVIENRTEWSALPYRERVPYIVDAILGHHTLATTTKPENPLPTTEQARKDAADIIADGVAAQKQNLYAMKAQLTANERADFDEPPF